MTATAGPAIEWYSFRRIDDDEYERVLAVRAVAAGDDDRRGIRRRYEALPRHDDVVDPGAVNADDAMLDRPDAVHVYTRVYDLPEGVGTDSEAGGDLAAVGEYVADAHERWRPEDPAALAEDDAFRGASEDHFRSTVAEAYALGATDGSPGAE